MTLVNAGIRYVILIILVIIHHNVVLIIEYAQFPEQQLQVLIFGIIAIIIIAAVLHFGWLQFFLFKKLMVGITANGSFYVFGMANSCGCVQMLSGGLLWATALSFDPWCFVQIDFRAYGIRRTNGQITFGALQNKSRLTIVLKPINSKWKLFANNCNPAGYTKRKQKPN